MVAQFGTIAATHVDSGNVVVTKPASTASGDLLLAIGFADPDGTTFTAPAGFTQQGSTLTNSTGQLKVWTKIAGGSEGSNYTWTADASASRSVFLLRITGADTSTPMEVTPATATGAASFNAVAPSVSPSSADALLVCGAMYLVSGTTVSNTPPSGMTERGDGQAPGLWISSTVASLELTASGATGTKSFTNTLSRVWNAVTIAVKSAGSGTNYDRTPGDSVGLTDAPAAEQASARTQADSLGLTDTPAGVQATTRTSADSVGISDSVDASLSGSFDQAPADAVGLSDVVAAVVTMVRSAADGVAITDTDNPIVLEIGETANDPVGLTDSVTAIQTRAITVADPVGLTDTATPALDGEGAAAPSDPVGLTDSATTTLAGAHALADAAAIIDDAAAALDRHQTTTDMAGITDAVSATISSGPNPADQVAVGDAVVAVLEHHVTVADSVAMADVASAFLGLLATPDIRTLTVPAASRVTVVGAESRTYTVPAAASRTTEV